MAFRCLWVRCTTARSGGGSHVPWGMIWGIESIEKANCTNECSLSSSSMHFTTSKGNIRRPSSYHSCLPGTHPTQPMHQPTPARNRCTHPRCTRMMHKSVNERTTAHFWTIPISPHYANCSLHLALAQRSATGRPCPYLLYLCPCISAPSEPHSLFPFSISWWGSPLSA